MRPTRARSLARLALATLTTLAAACRDDPAGVDEGEARAYNPDWSRGSHGPVAPQYAVVFPQDSANAIEIRMTAAEWSSIRANVKQILRTDFGQGGMGVPIGPGGPGGFPGGGPAGGPAGGPSGGPGGDLPPLPDPDYVPVTVTFGGKRWRDVGFRLKGNSGLAAAWSQGSYKLPFRLDFDEFEDRVPATRDQRLHGFRELSFSAGTSDNSLVREKLAADVLRAAGVPAARTAFYRVYVDFGAGLEYCGVYTAVEVIDDSMVRDQFGDDRGNLYKPESRLGTFVREQFEKKNNAAADWSDVRTFVAALNSSLRASDAARWRAGLEATFDVDHFLEWLAVNNAMVNWDAYGAIAHNYYLYNHPTRKLVWIPWDHDLSLSGNPGVTGTPGGGTIVIDSLRPDSLARDTIRVGPGSGPALGGHGHSLSMNEFGEEWPLIRYLADDPVYFARYKAHLRAFRDGVFTEARMDAMIDRYHALVAPHAVGPGGERPKHTHLRSAAAFTASPAELKAHVRARRATLAAFLP